MMELRSVKRLSTNFCLASPHPTPKNIAGMRHWLCTHNYRHFVPTITDAMNHMQIERGRHWLVFCPWVSVTLWGFTDIRCHLKTFWVKNQNFAILFARSDACHLWQLYCGELPTRSKNPRIHAMYGWKAKKIPTKYSGTGRTDGQTDRQTILYI